MFRDENDSKKPSLFGLIISYADHFPSYPAGWARSDPFLMKQIHKNPSGVSYIYRGCGVCGCFSSINNQLNIQQERNSKSKSS